LIEDPNIQIQSPVIPEGRDSSINHPSHLSFLYPYTTMYNNYSYHVIVGVFLQTLFSSTRGATIKLGWKDNADPRNNIMDMEKSGKFSPNVIKKLRRREACHQNCWEALGIFCASVVSHGLYCEMVLMNRSPVTKLVLVPST
jgi:uncharacterized MAPEG superfamily protein